MANENIPPLKPDWRKIVQKKMLKATRDEGILRYRSPYPIFNYRWEHVQTVVKLAIQLAKLTGADAEVVEAAAWLHDVAKHSAKQKHPKKGADIARKLLPTTNFPPYKVERVAQAIELHMGLWRNEPLSNLEAAVLWDADKLSKIGTTGAFHWLGDSFSQGRVLEMEDVIEVGRTANWQERTVASMHTEPARRAAVQRLERYRALWEELEMELEGADLVHSEPVVETDSR